MTETTIDFDPGTITVYADQVKVDDFIVDLHGNQWPVLASATESRRHIIVRSDGFTENHLISDNVEVVIVPGDGDSGRNLDKASSGSVQGFIETGRYSSENEERDINPASHTTEEV